MIQFNGHIFQMGWFKHQLVTSCHFGVISVLLNRWYRYSDIHGHCLNVSNLLMIAMSNRFLERNYVVSMILSSFPTTNCVLPGKQASILQKDISRTENTPISFTCC